MTKIVFQRYKINGFHFVPIPMSTKFMTGRSIKKYLVILILLITNSILLVGQNFITKTDLDKRSLKIYKEAVTFGRKKQFNKSLDAYEKVLEKYPNCIDAILRKAGMLHNLKLYEASATAFEDAIALAPEFDPQIYFSLAIVRKDLKQFDIAAIHFQEFIDRSQEGEKRARAMDLRDRCLFTHFAINNPVPFEPELLRGGVNTESHESVPKLNIEGDELIFTRRVNGQEDFYMAKLENGLFSKVSEINELNTPTNEGVHTLSADGDVLIFTACDRRLTSVGSCDLFYSYRVADVWSDPSNMGKVINSISWDGQPSLSSDGRKLFFSSTRQDGFGGKDIWVSTRTDTSGWTIPVTLPKEINTNGDEESPFLHPDGKTLYFRSNKHIGLGDFDIFYSKYVDSTETWTPAKNIGYPINTEGNEGAFFVTLDGKTAYYTSDMAYLEDRPKANLDIYTFELYEEARPLPSTFIKAIILDKDTNEPLQAHFSIDPLDGNIRSIRGISNQKGSFTTSLPTNMDYAFFVEKDGYLLHSQNFKLSGIQKAIDPYILEIKMTRIPKTHAEVTNVEPVILNNIFFETGSASLKKESDIELQKLYHNLNQNKQLKIEIHGHTDNIGGLEENQVLSEERAKAVMNALLSRGIDETRISFRGFGETSPRDTNETEEGRKNNRRTEFVLK